MTRVTTRSHTPGWSQQQTSQISSLLSTLLGGGGLSRGGNRGGSLSLETHLGVLASSSLVLADSVLSSSGLGLELEVFLAEDFSLGLVDLLNEDVLVLELVTLGGKVELVVHFAIDLLLVSVFAEKATEHTETAHPQNLLGHTGVLGTLSLTEALMTAYEWRERQSNG